MVGFQLVVVLLDFGMHKFEATAVCFFFSLKLGNPESVTLELTIIGYSHNGYKIYSL